MSYQSFSFLLFTAVVLFAYYLFGKKLQPFVLAAANLAFYVIAGVEYLPFILVTMIATFVAGRMISSVYDKADEQLKACTEASEKKALRAKAKAKSKKILLLSLFVAVGLLAVCKYTKFAISNVNMLLSAMGVKEISMFKMIMPLGVSFYTFMALSYVLDIYWKRYKAEKNFLYYAVYLSYFPHVVQGPIDRFNEFKDQIKDGVSFKYDNITYGAQLALWGFFKKLVIADRLNIFVSAVIDNWKDYDGIIIMAAIAVYSIQIYADFSGCIDIVSGVSEMFGIKLRKNFNHPYFSKTMPEFWRRWHISLQEWFKDYIYYPVSTSALTKKVKKYYKNKGKKRSEELFASCFPVLVVWLITGIWHGAAWMYVAWGMFHATLLIGSRVFEPVFAWINKVLHIDTDNFGWHLWQMIRTFILCCIGRIFFRASGLMNAIELIKKMVTQLSFSSILNKEIIASTGVGLTDIVISAAAIFVLLVVDIMQEHMKVRETLAKQNLIFRWIIIYIALFAVIIFGIYGPGYSASSFIYEQF